MLRRIARNQQLYTSAWRTAEELGRSQNGHSYLSMAKLCTMTRQRPLPTFSSHVPLNHPFSGQVDPKMVENEEFHKEPPGSHQMGGPSSTQSSQESADQTESEQSGSQKDRFKFEQDEKTDEGGWRKFASGFKSRWDAPNGDNMKDKIGKMANSVWHEVKDAVMPQEEVLSATRVRTGGVSVDKTSDNSPKDMIPVKKPASRWSKVFSHFSEQAEKHPFFSRLRIWQNQSKEFAEDIKDRIETSDHPMMHKIQDVQDRLFSEPEAAQVMREIRIREPDFDMVRFLKSVREDIPVVIKAYLEGNHKILEDHCTSEMCERLIGMYNHYAEQGTFQDPTLLFVSDVELFDATFVEKQPVLLVTFTCQQINCVRDRFSNVIEGKEDEIQQVYYAWAVQQDEQGMVDDSGKRLPPRWQLREMMIRLQHNVL